MTKYFADFVTGMGAATAGDAYFNSFISNDWMPLIWLAIFIGVTFVTVLTGVQKGIEKVSKFMMPVLVLLTIAVTIYSITLPGAMEGVAYYFKPDFSKFSIETVLAAMGQIVLFHVPGHGNYGDLWLLYGQKGKFGKVRQTDRIF